MHLIKVRRMTVGEAMQHYRTSGHRGVDQSTGTLQLGALHAAKDAEKLAAVAEAEDNEEGTITEDELKVVTVATAKKKELTTHWSDGSGRAFPHGAANNAHASNHKNTYYPALPLEAGGQPGITELVYGSDPNRELDDGSALVNRVLSPGGGGSVGGGGGVASDRAVESFKKEPFVARDGVEVRNRRNGKGKGKGKGTTR